MNVAERFRALELSDLPAVHAVNAVEGLTRSPLELWLSWASWAVVDNPFRRDEPIGWGIEQGGVLRGVVLFVWVPAKIAAWQGLAPMPFCLASGKVPLGGIKLLRPFLRVPSLLPHAIDFGAKLLSRSGGLPIEGSDISLTACLSRHRRVIRHITRRWFPKGAARLVSGRRKLGIPLHSLPASQLNDLAQRSTAGCDVCIIKDAAYLMWRYANQTDRFRAIVLEVAGGIDGLAILESMPEGDCRIMEFICDPSKPEAPEELLSISMRAAKATGHVMAYSRPGDVRLLPVWRRFGFAGNVKANPQFWVNPGPLAIGNAVTGHYSHGDHSFE